jgi:hypothetical protein
MAPLPVPMSSTRPCAAGGPGQFDQQFGIGTGISTALLTSNGRPKNSRWPTM